MGSARQARYCLRNLLALCFEVFLKRMFGKAQPRQAVGSSSSVVNLRTRRAVHTFTVWAGRLSSTGYQDALGITGFLRCDSGAPCAEFTAPETKNREQKFRNNGFTLIRII